MPQIEHMNHTYSVSRQVWDGISGETEIKNSLKIVQQYNNLFKVLIQVITTRIIILRIENLKNRDS